MKAGIILLKYYEKTLTQLRYEDLLHNQSKSMSCLLDFLKQGSIPIGYERFLENHDETRINSSGFAAHNIWSSIPAMMITATLHGGPFMIYFGQEFGEKANEIENLINNQPFVR
jgi:hypothetical protein